MSDDAPNAGQSDVVSPVEPNGGGLTSSHDCDVCRYSAILRFGVRLALVLLVVCYLLYISGLLPARVSFDQLPQFWGLKAGDYVARTGMPEGWQWLGQLQYGDVLTLVPAVLLAMLGIACLAAILPIYLRRKDYAMAVILLLQLAVMLAAAWPRNLFAH